MSDGATNKRIPGLDIIRFGDGDADRVRQEAQAGASALDIWRCSLRDPPAPLTHLKRTLSSDEVARCARLRSSRDRRRYATARGLLRLVLARYVGPSPRGLAFSYGSAGKPSLRDQGGRASGSHLHFNLSHSDDLLLIAISCRGPVGVDVERVRPIAHMDRIARRWLPREDYRAIRRARTEVIKAQRFFTAWTVAEARAKASGRGMRSTGREERRLGREMYADAHLPRRSPTVFRPAPGFVAAVAFGAPSDSTTASRREVRPGSRPPA